MLGLFFFWFFACPGGLLAPSGLDLGRFGHPFGRFLVPSFDGFLHGFFFDCFDFGYQLGSMFLR